MSTIIFSAPKAWGKTRQAAAIQATYGCHALVDEWSPRQPLTPGAVHLTNAHPDEIMVRSADVRVEARGWPTSP